jgi:hypothetical protein
MSSQGKNLDYIESARKSVIDGIRNFLSDVVINSVNIKNDLKN